MTTQTTTTQTTRTGIPLGLLGLAFAAQFIAGLVLTIVLAGGAVFPSPFGEAADITAHFRDHQNAVRIGALLQFASSVPLALYAATAFARLHRLGVRAAGAHIALAGGLLAASFLACSALVSWVLSRSEVASEAVLVRMLQDFAFITGGPGHVVPLGLLLVGLAVSGLRAGVLPRGVALAGLVIAVIAGLSILVLVVPEAAYLLPAARFTGLAWLVTAGFLLPHSRKEIS